MPAVLIGGLAAMISGCTTPVAPEEIQLHTVSSESVGPVTLAAGAGVPITFQLAVEEHLDRPELAVRSGAQIQYSERNQWAEPLEDGLGRLLRTRLAATPGVSRIVASGGAPGSPPRVAVTVVVDRFEGDVSLGGPGRAVVDAGWRIAPYGQPSASALASGIYVREAEGWDGRDYERLKIMLTELADDLADAVATSVSENIAGMGGSKVFP
ncbi:MAG: ABC-type transport auxiliary lipoprotein family protein [Opitutaceae bacterium]